jgi:hypothetical protein
LPEQGILDTPTQETAAAAVIGTWFRCSGYSIFRTDEIGIQFSGDGTWYKLFPGSPGNVYRGLGFDQQGTWTLAGTSSPFTIHMVVFGGADVPAGLVFSDKPRKLRLTGANPEGTYAMDIPQ